MKIVVDCQLSCKLGWNLKGLPWLSAVAGAAISVLPETFQAAQEPSMMEWGAGISAVQAEGAVNKGGRGPSIWEPFSRIPFRVLDASTRT